MSMSHRNGIALTGVSHFNGVAKANIVAINSLLRLTTEELRVVAEAAATAESGTLFYIKSDRSNTFQDTGTATPATTVTDPIGRVSPVVGAETLTQATAGARPLLIATAGGYGWNCDGTDDYLGLSTTYFADADDTYVIASGVPADSAANRIMFHCGNSSANVRYPYLGVVAGGDLPTASWRGDDTQLRSCDGAVSVADTAVVLTASKAGSTKKLFVNGVQAGSTESNAVGTIASFTRSRAGSATTTTGYFLGPMALLYVSKTLTTAHQVQIERYAAALVGATYTVGL